MMLFHALVQKRNFKAYKLILTVVIKIGFSVLSFFQKVTPIAVYFNLSLLCLRFIKLSH